MFPRFSPQFQVDGAADAAVNVAPGIDPCVHNQARARLEVEWLVSPEACVQAVEQGGGGHLRGGVARTVGGIRGCRVDGHARVVDETHGRGGLGWKPLALDGFNGWTG